MFIETTSNELGPVEFVHCFAIPILDTTIIVNFNLCVLTCPLGGRAVSNTKACQSLLDVLLPSRNLTTRIKAKLRTTHHDPSFRTHQTYSSIGSAGQPGRLCIPVSTHLCWGQEDWIVTRPIQLHPRRPDPSSVPTTSGVVLPPASSRPAYIRRGSGGSPRTPRSSADEHRYIL